MLSKLSDLTERLFCFFALSVFTGAYLPIPIELAQDTLVPGDQNPVSTVCQAVVLAGLAILAIPERRRIAFVAWQSKVFIFFILLAGLSAAWSMAPEVTLRRVVTLMSAVLFGWYAYARFPMERNIKMLSTVILVSALLSAAAAIAIPQLGVMGGSLVGDWRGVYHHKNALGWNMTLGVLCFGWLWVHGQHRIRNAIWLLLCLAIAFKARSSTALVTIALLPMIGYGIKLARLPGLARLWAIYLLTIGLAAGAVLSPYVSTEFLGLLDKDPSLTGRVPVWGMLLEQIMQRPFFGFGYGAYFLDGRVFLEFLNRMVDWIVVEAHEGYLELLLQLGVVGLVLGTWPLIGMIRLGLSKLMREELFWADFATVFAISFAIANLTQSMILLSGDVNCVISVMLYAGLRGAKAERSAKASHVLKRDQIAWAARRIVPAHR